MQNDDKNLIFHEEGKEKIRNALNLLDQIAKVFSKKGGFALVSSEQNPIVAQENGEELLENLPIVDQFEAIVVKLVLEAALKTKRDTGGGLYETIQIAKALYDEGLKKGEDPTAFKKYIAEEAGRGEAAVFAKMRPLSGREETHRLVKQAVAGDEKLARIFLEAIDLVGIHGAMIIEPSFTQNSSVINELGYTLDIGYISPFFVTDPLTRSSKLENAQILVTDQKLSKTEQIIAILKHVEQDEPLLILAPSVEEEALETLIINKVKRNLNLVVIALPNKKMLEGAAQYAGGSIITLAHRFDDPSMLGRVKQVIAYDKRTTLLRGDSPIKGTVRIRVGGPIRNTALMESGLKLLRNAGTGGVYLEEELLVVIAQIAAIKNGASLANLLLLNQGIVINGEMLS